MKIKFKKDGMIKERGFELGKKNYDNGNCKSNGSLKIGIFLIIILSMMIVFSVEVMAADPTCPTGGCGTSVSGGCAPALQNTCINNVCKTSIEPRTSSCPAEEAACEKTKSFEELQQLLIGNALNEAQKAIETAKNDFQSSTTNEDRAINYMDLVAMGLSGTFVTNDVPGVNPYLNFLFWEDPTPEDLILDEHHKYNNRLRRIINGAENSVNILARGPLNEKIKASLTLIDLYLYFAEANALDTDTLDESIGYLEKAERLSLSVSNSLNLIEDKNNRDEFYFQIISRTERINRLKGKYWIAHLDRIKIRNLDWSNSYDKVCSGMNSAKNYFPVGDPRRNLIDKKINLLQSQMLEYMAKKLDIVNNDYDSFIRKNYPTSEEYYATNPNPTGLSYLSWLVHCSPYSSRHWKGYNAPTREDSVAKLKDKKQFIYTLKEGINNLQQLNNKELEGIKKYCQLSSEIEKLKKINTLLDSPLTPEQVDQCKVSYDPIKVVNSGEIGIEESSQCLELFTKMKQADLACGFSDVRFAMEMCSNRVYEGFREVSGFKFTVDSNNPKNWKFYKGSRNNLGNLPLESYPYRGFTDIEKKWWDNALKTNLYTDSMRLLEAAGYIAIGKGVGGIALNARKAGLALTLQRSLHMGAALCAFHGANVIVSDALTNMDPVGGQMAAELFNTLLFALGTEQVNKALFGNKGSVETYYDNNAKTLRSRFRFDNAAARDKFVNDVGLTRDLTLPDVYIDPRTGQKFKIRIGSRGADALDIDDELLLKLAEDIKANCKCKQTTGCFLANTPIKMADGSYKNIQDIVVGEKVAAFDIANMKPATAEVTTTFKRPADKYLIIEYDDAFG